MKKILKWPSLLMIVLMVGFLASCSGGHDSSSTYDGSEESVITEQVITETIIYEEVIR